VCALTDKGLKAGPELVVEGDDVAEAEAIHTEGAAEHSHHAAHRQLDVPELDTDVLGATRTFKKIKDETTNQPHILKSL
jgi:hypothetical protein